MKLLFLDTETGGLDCRKHALLTMAYTITDDLYNILKQGEFSFPIIGEVTKEALDCNGLDVENWTPTSSVEMAIESMLSNVTEGDFTLVGHNIQFDLSFIKEQHYQSYIHIIDSCRRAILDTKSLVQYLKLQGKYEGSTSMHKFINAPRGKHNALQDTEFNLELLKKIDILNNTPL